ncbi:MBL fold metallo-hydrolase [Natronococcus occultus]|uniref:Zn-dependent hydrolase, glyoxylase n=1 Tax=Natronococcus occultus SP4 TaxID=694430 RepID=L0JWU5_9EURY|nr:MBL fold metallo-hydrolase [Natronococcus occultus]AGB36589.1 Zn-dependent hydrolase, glyoxylase [Natronococcus occultus SP4]
MTAIVRVPVGGGTPEGTNSAYLLPDRGVLVDPGPPSERAWADLRDGIGAHTAIEDLEHVFVTHWHIDHAGLAHRLADRAGAAIHVHREDAPLIGDYADARASRLRRDERTLERWGVPKSVRESVIDRDEPSPLPDAAPVNRHDDGDVVAGVEFVHTPGHTKGHASVRIDGTILLGDLLLPTYTPNVGGSDTRLDDPLGAYLSSLERVATHEEGEPGHGTTMSIDESIADVRRHHRDRAASSFEAIAAADETAVTPWTVARHLFGEMAGVHAKFGAGEAAAHLARLAELRIVERWTDDRGRTRYRPAVDSYPAELSLGR